MVALERSASYFSAKKFNWGWIDAFCHTNLLDLLDVPDENVPFLVYYVMKTNKFKIAYFDFTFKNLINFVETIKTLEYESLDKAFYIDERDCESLREKE